MRRILLVGFYLFAGCVLVAIYNSPSKKLTGKPDQSQYVDYSSSVYSPFMLPAILTITGLIMPAIGIFSVYDFVYGILFPAFAQLTLYYGILILLTPSLRKKLRPKACAALWILPNLMYVAYTQPLYRVKPDVVISFDQSWAFAVMTVWSLGFVLTMGWYLFGHLSFRKDILNNAKTVWDEKVISVWLEELKNSELKIKKDILLISDKLTSPLTIGLYKSTVRIILPDKAYTKQQLRLIFRHELVHLRKNDNVSKFYFAFCNALCWFDPLMWGAMKQCAEDLERSCDEAVLIESDELERKLYTELILDSQANQRGFTTCLSASAQSLRHRLKTIMKPEKMWSGAWVLFLAVVLLALTTDKTAFAYRETHLDFSQFGEPLNAEMTQHYDDFTSDDEYAVDTDWIESLSLLSLDEISLMYKDSFSCEFCLSIKFEKMPWYSLKMAEIEGGVLIQEQRLGRNNHLNLYFCEALSLDVLKEMLHIEE